MNDALWKGVILSLSLCGAYYFSFDAIAARIDIPNQIGFIFFFCYWIPQLLYSLPILAMLRRKNLPKTHLGFKIVFILLLLLNIAFLVFVIRAGA